MDRAKKQSHIIYSIRNWCQIVFFIITIAIGFQFYLYVAQASGPGAITISRPAGVEGFLPIGALMGWKQFILTGKWDPVHPAAMVIIGFAVLLSFLLRKSFCSWFCPVGTLSEWIWKIGYRVAGRNFLLPKVIDLPLRGFKYALLLFFLWAISKMTIDQVSNFIESPYYSLSDVKMLFFFTKMTITTAFVLSLLFILSFLVKNFWCRYLCPYGALMGIFSLISLSTITKDDDLCIDCHRCSKSCPSSLPVAQKQMIRSPECTGCLDCVVACPVENALVLRTCGLSPGFWSDRRMALGIPMLFLVIVIIATLTGHWQGAISDSEFRFRLKTIHATENTHPTVEFDYNVFHKLSIIDLGQCSFILIR